MTDKRSGGIGARLLADWPLLATLALVGAILGGAISALFPGDWESEATVVLEQPRPPLVIDNPPPGLDVDDAVAFASSPIVTTAVAERLPGVGAPVTVTSDAEAQTVTFATTGANAVEARDLAQTSAEIFVVMRRDPQAATWRNQAATLEARAEDLTREIGEARIEGEDERIGELATQRDAVEAEAALLRSRADEIATAGPRILVPAELPGARSAAGLLPLAITGALIGLLLGCASTMLRSPVRAQHSQPQAAPKPLPTMGELPDQPAAPGQSIPDARSNPRVKSRTGVFTAAAQAAIATRRRHDAEPAATSRLLDAPLDAARAPRATIGADPSPSATSARVVPRIDMPRDPLRVPHGWPDDIS